MQRWWAYQYDEGSGFILQVRYHGSPSGGTWDRDPNGFLFRFFFFTGDVSLRTNLSPPLEWLPFPPLVPAVLITPKGTESPGSSRIEVIGALVFFPPSEVVQDKLHSPWPAQ